MAMRKRFPSKTFLKGFLRAYAVFLKIDPEMVLRSYQEEMGGPPLRKCMK